LRARILLNVSLIILISGALFTVAVFVLPIIRTPQTFITYGPNTAYGNSTYTISGYFLPPIGAGVPISLTISDFTPNSISMSLFPSSPNSVAPIGPPLVYDSDVQGPIFHIVVVSPADQAYGIYISSLNRTRFTMAVTSIWTLFYPLRGYLPVSFFLILLGAVGMLYFYQAQRREEEYDRVMAELKMRDANRPTA
jgi:hypothetical protein